MTGSARDATPPRQPQTGSSASPVSPAADGLRTTSEERLRALLEVSQALAAPFHLDTILQLVVDTATRLLALDTGALYLTDGDDIVLVATCPPLPPAFPDALRRAPLGEHPHVRVSLESGSVVVLPDTQSETLTAAERQVVEARGLRTILYVPLMIGTHPTGALILASTEKPHAFEEDDFVVCRGFSGQAAQTIENARLFESTRRFAEALEREVDDRRRVEEALRESEEKFRALFQQAGDYALVLDPFAEGGVRIVDANEAACHAHGYTREELVGLPVLALETGNLTADAIAGLVELALSGQTLKFETLHRRKDGSTFPVEVTATSVRVGSRAPLVFSLERDISERVRLDAERHALHAQLTQADKMESIGRLAGGVAHDFNNMIQAILGNASLVLEDLPPDSPFRESLEDIRKAAERSADLTRQLLAFARKQAIEPRVVDLNTAVEGMLRMLRRLIGESITLAWLPATNLSAVLVDPSQIDQLVANLCVNARDAIGARSGRITIETRMATVDDALRDWPESRAPGGFVVLSVSDDGCGMDAETLAHIFEPFFTTKGLGKGTGLGLATAYGIVQQNRGFITVSSELNVGTTFRVHLPAHVYDKGGTGGRKEAGATARGAGTVLLVEDEPSVLQATRLMLERMGYRVLPAGSPADAIRLVEGGAERVDYLVTDVVMPEMNGRDLAARVRRCCPGIGCLFMSGYTADIVTQHGVLDEGVRFIQKPFSSHDLAAKLEEMGSDGPSRQGPT